MLRSYNIISCYLCRLEMYIVHCTCRNKFENSKITAAQPFATIIKFCSIWVRMVLVEVFLSTTSFRIWSHFVHIIYGISVIKKIALLKKDHSAIIFDDKLCRSTGLRCYSAWSYDLFNIKVKNKCWSRIFNTRKLVFDCQNVCKTRLCLFSWNISEFCNFFSFILFLDVSTYI